MTDRAGSIEEDVARHTGLDAADAEHVTEAVVDALGELLTTDEAHAICAHLPPRLAELLLVGVGRDAHGDVESLVAGVAWRENVPRAVALEHVTSVCDAIAARLPPSVRERLRADLPRELATLLTESASSVPPAHFTRTRRHPPRPTLASGRPGSTHPVSEARADRAQTHSVTNPEPHADSKLSSARGTTQEQTHGTLAEGEPGPTRTIAGR